MNHLSLAFSIVTMFAIYVAVISVIVTGRMDKETDHKTRCAIVVSGGIAAWAIQKTALMQWQPTPMNITHAIIVAVIAFLIYRNRRIQT